MSLMLARCPTTELDSPLGADPIPHRQDRLTPVRVHQPRNVSISLGLNYSEFPNSCLGREFLVVVKRYHIITYGFEDPGTVPGFCQENDRTGSTKSPSGSRSCHQEHVSHSDDSRTERLLYLSLRFRNQ
jgi:hypothetical protein